MPTAKHTIQGKPILRLKRVGSRLTSIYATRDGRYEIVKDPTSGDEGGWGYTSWLIYDKHDEGGGDEPMISDRFGRLADARYWLENWIEMEGASK